jgi:antitoxin PrlF
VFNRKINLVSKVTQKYQATIPQAVREKLQIEQGDCISFEIKDEEIVLKKALPLDWEYLNAVSTTMSEWSSDADEKAWHDL